MELLDPRCALSVFLKQAGVQGMTVKAPALPKCGASWRLRLCLRSEPCVLLLQAISADCDA